MADEPKWMEDGGSGPELKTEVVTAGQSGQPAGAEPFDAWCLIELFGHSRIAGRVTAQSLGGASLVRVDVPAVDGRQGFTKFYGPSAIYSIAIVDEAVARAAVMRWRPRPVDAYVLPELSHPQLPFDDDEDRPDGDEEF